MFGPKPRPKYCMLKNCLISTNVLIVIGGNQIRNSEQYRRGRKKTNLQTLIAAII